MKNKAVSNMLLSLLLIGVMSVWFVAYSEGLTSTGNSNTVSSEPFPTNRPVLFLDPDVIERDVGVDFTVGVKIFNLTDAAYTDPQNKVYPLGNLYGVGMNLTWDPSVLEYVSHLVKIPVDDYPDGVLYYPTTVWEDNLNIDAGWYKMAHSSSNPAPPFNNPGQNNTVFEITFRAKNAGSSDLLLTQVALPGKNVGDRVYHEGYDTATGRGAVFSTSGIPEPPGAPIASFAFSPAAPKVGEAVMFDASASYDPDGEIISYSWDFGDGATATGENTTHTYATHGTYRVTLTLTDNDGLTGTQTRPVRIRTYPVAAFTYSPLDPRETQTVTFDASASYDPDGFIFGYYWDFGDKTIGVGRTTSHAYQTLGSYDVSLTVTDNDGLTNTIVNPITVLAGIHDVAITYVNAYPRRVMPGQYVEIDVEVANQGTSYEIFEVTVYYDDNMIGRGTWGLHPGEIDWAWLYWRTTDIPEGVYTIRAEASVVSGETDLADNIYVDGTVTIALPKISISPASGPVGTKVAVEGQGFPTNAGGYLMFDDQLIGFVFVDSNGNLNAVFNVPFSEAGSHIVKVVWSYYSSAVTESKATFIVSEVTPLDVTIDVGAIFFKGETVEFYVQTVFNGKAVDATSINPTLHLPDGTTQTLTWQRIATGLYKLRYATSGKGSMIGTYTLVVEAGYTTETVDSHGTSIKAFLIKSTWEREMPKAAAFSIASLGLISAMLVLWRKEKKRLL